MTDLAAFQHFRSRKSQPVLFCFISRVTSSVSIRQSAERGNRKVVGTFDTNRAVIVAVPNCHRWRSDNLDNSFFRVHLMAQKLMICVFFFLYVCLIFFSIHFSDSPTQRFIATVTNSLLWSEKSQLPMSAGWVLKSFRSPSKVS